MYSQYIIEMVNCTLRAMTTYTLFTRQGVIIVEKEWSACWIRDKDFEGMTSPDNIFHKELEKPTSYENRESYQSSYASEKNV